MYRVSHVPPPLHAPAHANQRAPVHAQPTTRIAFNHVCHYLDSCFDSGRLDVLKRAPRRLSVTVSDALFLQLQQMADLQGRSTSNLCAYLLERVVQSAGENENSGQAIQYKM